MGHGQISGSVYKSTGLSLLQMEDEPGTPKRPLSVKDRIAALNSTGGKVANPLGRTGGDQSVSASWTGMSNHLASSIIPMLSFQRFCSQVLSLPLEKI